MGAEDASLQLVMYSNTPDKSDAETWVALKTMY